MAKERQRRFRFTEDFNPEELEALRDFQKRTKSRTLAGANRKARRLAMVALEYLEKGYVIQAVKRDGEEDTVQLETGLMSPF